MAALYGWRERTPAMLCTPCAPQGHRERETCACGFAASPSTTPVGAVVDLPDWLCGKLFEGPPQEECVSAPPKGDKTSGLVTKLLDHKEMRSDPKAIKALQVEGRALADIGTWDESTVAERDDVIREAKENNETIHLGDLLGICSIKHHEMQESMWKHKGRWCFRAPTTRDEKGSRAIFQELASRPTTVTATNVNIFYGCLPGHKNDGG